MTILYFTTLIIDLILVYIAFRIEVKQAKNKYEEPIKVKDIEYNILIGFFVLSFIPFANLLLIIAGILVTLYWLKETIGEIEL